MQYKNPIIFSDYSDPDVISSGKYFYLVASSFNFVPGVPVLRSQNLVEWELVNYVVKTLPFARFNANVCAGDGVWAPSIRYNNGKYYCLIPFPDDGIYVSEATAPEGNWSPLRRLIAGNGLIDPCPIWEGGRCFVAVAFAHSRAGFNSAIGLYEVTPDLRVCISQNHRIIYDGRDANPIIEGPKFYKRGGYYYILAPAGSVKSGWQVALRSKNLYGPYESKVILMQGDSPVNGPHQGAMVQTQDGKYYFLHFQDMRAYGRIVHLQPVEWQDDWPMCGKVKYRGIAGTPVEGGDYPVPERCADGVNQNPYERKFWQTPCNPPSRLSSGGALNFLPYAQSLPQLPNAVTCKLAHREFTARLTVELYGAEAGDEFGFGMLGKKYGYLSLTHDGRISIVSGEGDGVKSVPVTAVGGETELEVRGRFTAPYTLTCTFGINGQFVALPREITAGVWVGARFVLFARNREGRQSGGCAILKAFSVE